MLRYLQDTGLKAGTDFDNVASMPVRIRVKVLKGGSR